MLRQEPVEAAILGCASKQNGSSYNRDGAKRKSGKQQRCGYSRHRYGVKGSKSKHGLILTDRTPGRKALQVVDERR